MTPARPHDNSHDNPHGQKSPKTLERDIAHTRSELSETIDEIEHRLSPSHLKHEVMDAVHDTIDSVQDRLNPRRIARQAGTNMMQTIKENPLPSLIAGLSVGWLLTRGQGSSNTDSRYDGYGYETDPRPRYTGRRYGSGYDARRYPAEYGYGEYGRPSYDDRRGYTDDRYDYDGSSDDSNDASIRDRAAEQATAVRDQVASAAGTAQEQVQYVGRQVYSGANQATNWIEDFVLNNPLAAGALAAGVGALLGGMAPSTDLEDEWMGETRDRLVHQADRKAADTLQRVEHVVERVAEEAQESAQQVKDVAAEEADRLKETAKAEAENQDLRSSDNGSDADSAEASSTNGEQARENGSSRDTKVRAEQA